MTPGRLIFLMGPSGSGKDSVLQAASVPLAAMDCRIVRRVITRSAEARGEEALSVSVEEFSRLERSGAFAMSWRANGLHYGIPARSMTGSPLVTTSWSMVHANTCLKPAVAIHR